MNISNIRTASFVGPTRLLLHSVEGFGKTTLAAHFPKPIFVCGERAFPRDLGFAPSYVEPKTWEDVLAFAASLRDDPHDFQSVVFDTWDWIDPLIQRFVLVRDTSRKSELNPKGNVLESIEDYGYGKGYVVVAEELRKLLVILDDLQARRSVHVVILAHSHVKELKNPAGENYDRYVPKVHERSARILVEWAETVLFGYYEVLAAKSDPKNAREKAKAVGGHRRIIGTRHNAVYDAKNRMNLPDTIELGDPRALVPYLTAKHLNPPPAHATTPAPAQKTSAPAATGPVAAAAAPPAAPNDADEKAKKAMLADAERVLGAKYRSDVERWLKSAGTDAKKLDAIFQRVDADIKAKEQPAQAAS